MEINHIELNMNPTGSLARTLRAVCFYHILSISFRPNWQMLDSFKSSKYCHIRFLGRSLLVSKFGNFILYFFFFWLWFIVTMSPYLWRARGCNYMFRVKFTKLARQINRLNTSIFLACIACLQITRSKIVVKKTKIGRLPTEHSPIE